MTMKNEQALTSSGEESDAHVSSRHMKTTVRILLVLSLVATATLLLFYPSAAYLAAIPVPVLTIVWGLLSYLEKRSRTTALRQGTEKTISQDEVNIDVETIGIISILKILGAIAVGAFIIAATFFDLAIVGTAAAIGFLLAVLFQIFYFPLFFIEAERDEREKLTHQRDEP